MAQINKPIITTVGCAHSYNLNIPINSTYENIALDHIGVAGLTNFAITVSNNSNTGNITSVSVYGSPDGSKYFLSNDSIFGGSILPNTTMHVEFALLTLFIRVTCQADANLDIDIHLQGNGV